MVACMQRREYASIRIRVKSRRDEAILRKRKREEQSGDSTTRDRVQPFTSVVAPKKRGGDTPLVKCTEMIPDESGRDPEER